MTTVPITTRDPVDASTESVEHVTSPFLQVIAGFFARKGNILKLLYYYFSEFKSTRVVEEFLFIENV